MSDLPHDTGANVDDYNERINFLQAENRGLRQQVVTYETMQQALRAYAEAHHSADAPSLDTAVKWLLQQAQSCTLLRVVIDEAYRDIAASGLVASEGMLNNRIRSLIAIASRKNKPQDNRDGLIAVLRIMADFAESYLQIQRAAKKMAVSSHTIANADANLDAILTTYRAWEKGHE